MILMYMSRIILTLTLQQDLHFKFVIPEAAIGIQVFRQLAACRQAGRSALYILYMWKIRRQKPRSAARMREVLLSRRTFMDNLE
jgi:hypothetical protein